MEQKTECPCDLKSKNCFVEQTEIEGKPFDTPTSMRNVDRECVAELMHVERK